MLKALTAITALLAMGPHSNHTRETMRLGDRGPGNGTTPVVRLPLCDTITAGDKSGAWECMYGDGTMAVDSNSTFVATGTPTNTTEGGYAVRTYTSAQNDEQPADAAFPASSFSVCMHIRPATNTVSQHAVFGTSGAAANFVLLAWEIQGAGGDSLVYTSNGTNNTNTNTGASLSTGTWYLLCVTYQRVGGAADNVVRTYVNGSQTAVATNHRLVHALSSKWSTNGYVGGSVGAAKATRGFFVTYKLLSADDIARLYGTLAL